MNSDGELRQDNMVRFQRTLPGPIERVWEYLTSSEQIAEWFGGAGMKYFIEPRAAGLVNLADGHIQGIVTQWKPPRLLAYTWNVFMPGDIESAYPESYVTFELQAQGNEVLLTLTHRPILDGFESQTMMGWHTILDALGSLVRGETPETRDVLMARNRERYGVKEIKF